MIRKFYIGFLLFFAAVYYYQPIEVADTGWHLSTGRWIISHGAVPHSDLFPIESKPKPWIFTQWLGSTLLALPYLCGGVGGLKIFRDSVFVLTIALFLLYSRRKLPLAILMLTTVCLIYGVGTRCLTRSFIFNHFFIALFLIILFRFIKCRSPRLLYFLPLLALVWGNIHLGSFVYGFLILGAFLTSETLLLLNSKPGGSFDLSRADVRGTYKHVWIVLGLFTVCVGVTPYGWEGFLYPYKVFLFPDYINFYNFTFNVVENKPPVYLLTAEGKWFWGMLALTAAYFWLGKKKHLFSFLLFIVTLFLFISFSRGSDLFAIVCAYIIADQSVNDSDPNKLPVWFRKVPWNKWVALAVFICLCAHMVKIAEKKAYLKGNEIPFLSLDYIPNHPKDSVDFLQSLKISGHVFCNEHTGSYILEDGYPALKTLVDGRQLEAGYFQEYFKATEEPRKYWPEVEKRFDITIVILDLFLPISGKLNLYLNQNDQWLLVNVDKSYVTYIKKGIYDLPAEIADFSKNLSLISASREDHRALMDLAKSDRTRLPINGLFRQSQFIDVLEEGVTLLDLGYTEAAVQKFAQSLSIDPVVTKKALKIKILK